MTVLTADEADRLLAAWDERLRRVDDNLLVLEGDPTYRLCEGRLDRVSGRTREVLAPVFSAVGALFADRERLSAVIERARAVRASMSALTFWDNDERQAEIEALLLGPSVAYEAGPTSLAGRSLLGDGLRETRETPDAVLFRMSTAFDRARDGLGAVSHAWAKLEPALAEARERARRLGAEAAAAGIASEETTALDRAMALAEADVARDPLGALDAFRSDVEARLATLTIRVKETGAAHARVTQALTASRALLDEARRAHDEALRAIDDVAREIVLGPGARALLADDASVAELGPWLARLEAAVLARHLGPAEVGLRRLRDAAEACLGRDRGALARVATLRAKRDELLGRVEARRAQLEALSARGSPIDPDAHQLAREARRLFETRPVSLGDATRAVEALERAMGR